MLKLKTAFALFALGVLSGCGNVPLTSIPALKSIDFNSTEVDRFYAAIQVPLEVRPSPNGVYLDVSHTSATGHVEKERVQLMLDQRPQIYDLLSKYQRVGHQFYVYSAGPTETQRLEKLRTRLQAKSRTQAVKKKGELSFGVQADSFCRLSDKLPRNATMDMLISTSETNRFVPLLRGVEILKKAKANGYKLSSVPTC